VAAYLYLPPLDGVVRALKFARAEFLGQPLGTALAAACRPWRSEVDVVTAVPLAWSRLLGRGYNQAEAIAAPVAACLDRPFRRLLWRRPRRRQASLGRAARRSNLTGAFGARRHVPRGGTVLLVDDVMTTGATVNAAAAALLGAGAGAVVVAVAARTPERSWGEAAPHPALSMAGARGGGSRGPAEEAPCASLAAGFDTTSSRR
jgi:ComF family protein